MSVDFYVKLRDGAQLIADAAGEQLEKMASPIVKTNKEDFEKLQWTEKEGSQNNPYQQTTKEANQNNTIFQALQQILGDHKGFFQNSSHKFWFHQNDKDTIDRRKK